MTGITERQKFILDKIIREYIKQARPISSDALEKRYNLGIKPASIRLEMHRLAKAGFLEQPYVSAGRVPTDKGYRFFVDELLKRGRFGFPEEKLSEKASLLAEEAADSFAFLAGLTKLLADLSLNLGLIFLEREAVFFKEGWPKIFKEPEFEERECAREFTIMVEKLEEGIEEFLNDKEESETSKIKVFIGKESKIPCAEKFSLILSPAHFPKRRKGILALLGPKRMRYSRNIGLIDALANFLENVKITR